MDTTKYKFHKLTPIRDVKLNVYADSLDYVFRDDDLKNIAITGPYSSGKSSMLETYKAAHKDMRFIHISLAHFETATNTPNNADVDTDDKMQEFEADIKAVEGKILNQLIHQIDTKKIPQTHFKIKRPLAKKLMAASAVAITAFFAMIIFLFNRNTWINFANGIVSDWLRNVLKLTTFDGFVVAILGICSLIVLYGIYSLLKLQHNKNFLRKLSVQGNEIEIFENDDDSFFDKHLNEVLYLFRHTTADAIVFEDMDRYNSNQIFEKLREINYLLNNSPNSFDAKIFRFFYLLRDDIFTSKDRTKFFDFIIPIVPVIDGANSYDKFIEYFKDGEILDSFDGSFLQEISMYIDDMRLLKNIYNEYRFYHERIQLTELSNNKLLGMIAYKNLFPRDFSELQLGKGYVFCLFRSKEQFIEVEITNIKKRVAEINEFMAAAEQEQLHDIDELDALFFNDNDQKYLVNDKRVSEFSTRGKLMRAMKDHPNNIYQYNSHYGWQQINLSSEFDKLDSIPEYSKRKELIEAKTFEKKQSLQEEVRQLNVRRKELENATLSEIVQISKDMAFTVFSSTYTDEINVLHEYKDVKGSLYFPLIKYLIRNKHIDENYPDYMSYFYEQSISRTDQIFVRSVFDVEFKPFTYPLKDTVLVASKISSRYYSQPEVLNFDLFAFILASNNKNLPAFLEQLRNNHRIDFVIEFWKTDKEKPLLLRSINKVWPGIWLEISQKDLVAVADKNKYLVDTFYYSPYDEIGKMNIDNAITTHISTCADFLSVDEPQVPLIIEALKFLKVRFVTVNYDVSNEELFSEMYSQNLYEINQSLVFLLLEKIYQLPENENFFHKNYSLLMTKPDEPVVSYIDANMDTYISLVCTICKGEITDDEVNVLAVLNHSGVDRRTKAKYIEALSTEIREIGAVNDTTLWTLLLSQHHVPCSNSNILSYYFNSDNAFDKTLTNFINTSDLEKGLSYSGVVGSQGKENALAFYKSLITNNDLDNEKYTLLLSGFGTSYPKFAFEGIDQDKAIILIKFGIIKMNVDNLMFIREKYSSCKMRFILANIDEYAQNVISAEVGNFDLTELKCLLKENISDQNLLKLLSFTDEPISIKGANISDPVKKHIIKNNYCKSDLPLIVSGYDNEPSVIKEITFTLCANEIDHIIENNIRLPYSLLDALLQSSNASSKEELLAAQLADLTREQAVQCFTSLQMGELLTVFEGKWPSIAISDTSTLILETMESKKWISSFAEDEDKDGYYRVRARRNMKQDEKLPDHLL